MTGGLRLLSLFLLVLLTGAVAMVWAADAPTPAGPPKAKVAPVEDTVQGHKIVDPYRYLENREDPDTKQYVEQELAYTRSVLDPLPGRDTINARLSQLLTIGTIGAPQIGGKYYQTVISGVQATNPGGLTLQTRVRTYWHSRQK